MGERRIINQRFEISAVSSNGKRVRDLIEKFCQEAGLTPSETEGLQLAVSEAFNNAVEHGLEFNETETVVLVLESRPTKVVIQIEDRGKGIDFKKISWQGPKINLGERGRGFQIIHAFIDGIQVERLEPTGTRLTLVHWKNHSQETSCLRS
jgi:serine/threonine-protein kinase RsbW